MTEYLFKTYFSFRNLFKKQEGQTWMEYGMIIGGVILVIALVIGLFGDKLMGLFGDITDSIEINDPNGNGW
jgi:Flp pilus assembly pilin Flp